MKARVTQIDAEQLAAVGRLKQEEGTGLICVRIARVNASSRSIKWATSRPI
jgi:hypothetical protein